MNLPTFCEKQFAVQVAVFDTHCGAVESQVGVAVVARVDFFAIAIATVVPCEPAALVNIGVRASLDRHATMPDAAAETRDSTWHGIFIVDRELMLVAPEPDHRAMNEFRQLLRR